MRCRIIFLAGLVCFSWPQSLFNRWVGSDPFSGTARSNAMGQTHLVSSENSTNVRFNPGHLSLAESRFNVDVGVVRNSVRERWGMPVRDSFDEFLTNADYVANEFGYIGSNLGTNILMDLSAINIGVGIHYGTLTHFTYDYQEEVRGSYSIEDGEYAGKDPLVGFHKLSTSGQLDLLSIGGGLALTVSNVEMNGGLSLNFIPESEIKDVVEIDSLYSDVTNLSSYSDARTSTDTPSANFIAVSAGIIYRSNLSIAFSMESGANIDSETAITLIDTTTGLLTYWSDDDSAPYSVVGIDYQKPEVKSIALSYTSNQGQPLNLAFQWDNIIYDNHLNLANYQQWKFGFEYITPHDTPIRAGLIYKGSPLVSLKPTSSFTCGSGKRIGNVNINFSASYTLQLFSHPDLFPVENDVRIDYDTINESQLDISVSLQYKL